MSGSLGYVLKRWRDRPFLEIRRRDVANLLDEIEDKHSPGVADGCLAVVRKLFRWFEARADDYISPIVPGMSRSHSQARERILSDDEIRAVWAASVNIPMFGDFVRVLLLTGQRRAKVAQIAGKISPRGVPGRFAPRRGEGKPGKLHTPAEALDIIARQPRLYGCTSCSLVGAAVSIAGFNKRMAALRDKLTADMPQWQLHDLRRTARSLLSRAGVRPEISERVLGHAMPGVEAVYDRHDYASERADALRRLADLITVILATQPEGAKVIPLKAVAQPTAAR